MKKIFLMCVVAAMALSCSNAFASDFSIVICRIANCESVESKMMTFGENNNKVSVPYNEFVLNIEVIEKLYGNCEKSVKVIYSSGAEIPQPLSDYKQFISLLDFTEDGVKINQFFDVYKEQGGAWIVAPFSGGRYLCDSFEQYGRKVNLSKGEGISTKALNNQIQTVIGITDAQKVVSSYYEIGKDMAIPIMGIDVRYVVDYLLALYSDEDRPCQIIQVDAKQPHNAVDLGLSVKWADCNIGARSVAECGAYYAWGEIEQKSIYSNTNYKFSDASTITKYYNDEYPNNGANEIELYTPLLPTNGKVDNLTKLVKRDDVARSAWGKHWRIPTVQEFQELIEKCSWEWSTKDGVKGYIVTSKINGNSIFLPITGYWLEDEYIWNEYNCAKKGVYATSSLSLFHNQDCYTLIFDNKGYSASGFMPRNAGIAVRAVYDK